MAERHPEPDAPRPSEEQFRLLVASVRDYAIFMLDTGGHVATWNAGAELIKGYRAGEIIGRHFSIFYPEEALARDWPAEELRRAVAVGRFEDEGWRVRRDGSQFWANVVITALFDDDGRHIGFAKVTRDLTERRAAEERARELIREQAARAEAESMAGRLEELTLELEQTIEELQMTTAHEAAARADADAARRHAEEASRAKSQFLAVMSHELRTPLNAIMGFADLIAGEVAGPLTEAQRQHVSRIQSSSLHLLELINRVLSLSRIEAGHEDLHISDVDIVGLARECADLIAPAAARKDLSLVEQLPPGPVMIRTDAGKVRQILLNLLNNGVKYTDEGSIELTLSEEGNGVRLQVRDTGIGIPPEHVRNVFSPFVQVDPASPRGRGGTGLGLSVTRELARLLGGDVTLESELGRGSTFSVTLPMVAPAFKAAS